MRRGCARVRCAAVPLLGALLAGCATVRRHRIPDAAQEWLTTLTAVQSAVSNGRYGEADQLLTRYGARYSAEPQARQTAYWRALLRLDPANDSGGPLLAVYELDRYLEDSAATEFRTQALVIRRVALAMDSTRSALAATESLLLATRQAPVDTANTREQALRSEVARLTDSLSRTTAELDRIKRRLAAPKTP